MHKLMVLYPEPADPGHFRDYYVSNHLPLVTRMPGLLAWRYSFEVLEDIGDPLVSRQGGYDDPEDTLDLLSVIADEGTEDDDM
jgi:hypothetical protein